MNSQFLTLDLDADVSLSVPDVPPDDLDEDHIPDTAMGTQDTSMDEVKDEVKDEDTDEVIDEVTDEVIDEVIDEIIDEGTDEVIDEGTDEVIDEDTDEVSGKSREMNTPIHSYDAARAEKSSKEQPAWQL